MNTVEIAPRVALSNCTNSSLTSNPLDLRPLKRCGSTGIDYNSTKKRPRVRVEQTVGYDQHTLQIPNDPVPEELIRGGHRNYTTFSALRSARTRPRRFFDSASVSSRPILDSFVSSHKCDVYHLRSRDDPIALGLPFACAFTADAKRGGVPILAVATQDGTVELLNVRKRQEWDIEPQRTTIQVHSNAILDAKWRMDDQCLATSSGDSTTRVTCIATQQSLAVLAHHTSSVKSLDWNPDHSDLLSTAGRDGSICVWDLRTATQGNTTSNSSAHVPVVIIPHAHCDVRPRGKIAKSRTSVKTVTSILYLPQNSQQLISSGSFDGVLKQWDLRYPITGRTRRPVMLFESYSDPTLTTGSRARGLSGLALGRNHSASLVWGIAADSCIHTYTLPLTAPSEALNLNKLSHPGLFVNSFYVKLATSPCGSWLASGSSGGGVYLWDVANRSSTRTAVELKSAGREVGAVDWGIDSVAACCDDGTVRIWRPNQEASIMCKTDLEEHRWNWAWATENPMLSGAMTTHG